MMELTKERLQEIAEDGFLKHGEAKSMARQMLAGLGQEPVYQVQHGEHWRDLNKAQYNDHVNLGADGLRILYAAPQLPQPAVPDAISTRQAISKMEECEPCDSINVAYKYWWNACRAAMLHGDK